jgi:hypothetical protein
VIVWEDATNTPALIPFENVADLDPSLKLPVEEKNVVVVAPRAVKFWRVVEPVRRRFESVVNPPVAVSVPVKLAVDDMFCPLIKPEVIAVAKRFVVEAKVEKNVVEVALVVVALTPVKFWRVVDADTKRLPITSNTAPVVVVALPPTTTDVAVFGYIVRPFVDVAHFSSDTPPPHTADPTTLLVIFKHPSIRLIIDRPEVFVLVNLARVAKNVVEVALVVVALIPVKFWRVVEPVTSRLDRVVNPEMLMLPAVRVPIAPVVANKFVELATVAKNVVEVALVVVAFLPVKFCKVEDARERKPPLRNDSPETEIAVLEA